VVELLQLIIFHYFSEGICWISMLIYLLFCVEL
jgi:hypothetical protein